MSGDEKLMAAIWLPSWLSEKELAYWRRRCIVHCVLECYRMDSIVTGDEYAWERLHEQLLFGEVQVIVVGRREHMPAERVPRVEEAGVEMVDGPIAPRQQRARVTAGARGRTQRLRRPR